MPNSSRILLIGGGRMGQALLKGWARSPLVSSVRVVEPAPAPGLLTLVDDARISLGRGGDAPDVVVIAVKPQVLDQVLPTYRDLVDHGALFVSIAAGKRLATLEALLAPGARIARAMPNTPAEVGRGVTVLVANGAVDDADRARAAALMGAVGQVAWVSDEASMDAVTAVSGSGPAYVFHLVEALEAAARAAGLDPDLARLLARATVSGAGALLDASAETAAGLRQAVTSPAGTTAAALDVLMAEPGLTDLMTRAVAAAARRSAALAG